MHPRQGPANHELMSILHESLRSFQQRRDIRRSRVADIPPAAPPPSPGPMPAGAAGFDLRNASPTMMGPRGFVEVDGHAIPVMDPEFLQALQDQVRGVKRAAPPTATPQAPAANDRPAAPTSETAAQAPVTPPPAAAPSPASPPISTPPPSITPDVSTAPPAPAIKSVDNTVIAELMREHCEQMTAALREHEARLKEQADAAAERQATLMRELTATHRAQMDEQAARHTAVIRDLLRENQNFLDERANSAITREAQLVGTLLREHREALAQAHETHCQTLDDVLEHHRAELREAQPAHSGSGDLRQLQTMLAECARIQHAAHASSQDELASLLALIQKQGENFASLALHLAQQDAWLPPPNLAPPPEIPRVPTPGAPPGLAAVIAPTITKDAPVAAAPPDLKTVISPTITEEAVAAAPPDLKAVISPTITKEAHVAATTHEPNSGPENVPAPPRLTAAMRREAELRERARVYAAVAEGDDEDNEAPDDDELPEDDDTPSRTRPRISSEEDTQHD